MGTAKKEAQPVPKKPMVKKTTGKKQTAPTSPEHRLIPRDREILKDIIHTHMSSGEPVSSRAVSKHDQHGLSAATIRNVMADLEELGLLRQPHTSAGRVPTEAAYRLYIESLMRARKVPVKEQRYIDQTIARAADADHKVDVVGQLLSELSSQIGVVLTPAVNDIVLRSADFVPMGKHQVLCVFVSESGFVDNVVVEIEEEIARRDLVRFSNFITSGFSGHKLPHIREQLLQEMVEARTDVDQWLSRALEVAKEAFGKTEERGVLVKGANTLLGQPELKDLDRVQKMLDTFADNARLAHLLSLCLETNDSVRVYMGSDSEVTSELDFSLVAVPYGTESSTLGSLGVFGPSRMEYPRLVPLVRYLGETLSKSLTAVEQDSR